MCSTACPRDAQQDRTLRRSRLARAFAAVTALLTFLATGAVLEFVSVPEADAVTGSASAANSADRLIVWTNCADILTLKDAELTRWKDLGVDGFACGVRLPGMGGSDRFTADLNAVDDDDAYQLERYLHESRIAERARKRGLSLYLGFYLSNSSNAATPLGEWFDDAAWNATVLPAARDLAGAARALGFKGLALDQELYAQEGGRQTATWAWDYPGNVHSEAAVRDQARTRGQQVMRALLDGYPAVEVLAYDTKFPDTWDEVVQQAVNDLADANQTFLHIDFWDGMTSVEGYRSIQFLNATFYKTPHLGSWDSAFTYEFNRLYAMLSRRLSNWDYAADRVFESPFVWINGGEEGNDFEAARSVEYVAEQLDAARRWGMHRMFANFSFGKLRESDYEPYADAMRASSRPGVVDEQPPRLSISRPASDSSGDRARIAGTATDDFAIHSVRWRTETGTSGSAEMTWNAEPADVELGWHWRMDWSADDVPLHDGRNVVTVTVEDIKGLVRTRSVTITR